MFQASDGDQYAILDWDSLEWAIAVAGSCFDPNGITRATLLQHVIGPAAIRRFDWMKHAREFAYQSLQVDWPLRNHAHQDDFFFLFMSDNRIFNIKQEIPSLV